MDTLSIRLIVSGIVVVFLWGIFWVFVSKAKHNLIEIIQVPAFIKTVTIVGIASATTTLGIAKILDSAAIAAIISGLAGYVLGSTQSK